MTKAKHNTGRINTRASRGRRRLSLDKVDPMVVEEAKRLAAPGPYRIDVIDETEVIVTNKLVRASIKRS